MNNKVSIDKTVFLILYYKYKEYFLPITLLGLSLLLLTQFLMPQLTSWFALQNQVTANEQQVSVMSQNAASLTRIDSTKQSSLLATATMALPQDKDYAGILAAISGAASIANVSLGDYSFQIGNLQGKGIQTQNGKLAVTVQLTINGGLDDAKKFITALQKQLPLSDITSLEVQGVELTTITANFYYSPFPPAVFNAKVPVQTITQVQEDFISSLASGAKLQVVPLATPSAHIGSISASLQ